MFRRPPAAAETWDGFGTGSGIRDRARDSDRVDRDRYRDGGPGRRGRKRARMFQRARRREAWVVGYVGSGGSRWRRSPCNCSAVAATSVLLRWRKSCCQATARASAERCVTERNRLSSV